MQTRGFRLPLLPVNHPRLSVLIGILLLATFCARRALADITTYTYIGNPFDFADAHTPNHAISGLDDLSGAFTIQTLGANLRLTEITPISFSFTDGLQTTTNANETLGAISVSTDANANIFSWSIDLFDVLGNGGEIKSDGNDFIHDFGIVGYSDNFWDRRDEYVLSALAVPEPAVPEPAVPAPAVPEPSSIFLLATVMGVLGFGTRRWRQQ